MDCEDGDAPATRGDRTARRALMDPDGDEDDMDTGEGGTGTRGVNDPLFVLWYALGAIIDEDGVGGAGVKPRADDDDDDGTPLVSSDERTGKEYTRRCASRNGNGKRRSPLVSTEVSPVNAALAISCCSYDCCCDDAPFSAKEVDNGVNAVKY